MKVSSIVINNNLVQNRKSLMKYACEKGAGFMKELKAQDFFNGKIVDELMSMGFINVGYTKEEKTWSATQLLKDFAREIDLIKK